MIFDETLFSRNQYYSKDHFICNILPIYIENLIAVNVVYYYNLN